MSPGAAMATLRRRAVLLAMLPVLAVVPRASGAGRDPRVGYVYPAGGQRGTTFEATLGGQYLFDATRVDVSGDGVAVTIVERERQLTPKEQNDLQETLAKLQEKRKQGLPFTPEELKSAEDIRKKLTAFGRRLANPSLGEFLTVRVEVGPQAVAGRRELRLVTSSGLSNPLAFLVDVLPEVTKPDWKNVPEARGSMNARVDAKPPERNVSLPAILNGQIPPGGVDRYRFTAKAGQKLVVLVRARELIPYIADAVPGWFQATVTLSDAAGKELAYDDDYRFHPDPVLFFKIAAAGDYVLEVKDALFRGREDFVYRITAGELPFVTDVFPLGGAVGTRTTVAVSGWNLPFAKLPLDLFAQTPGTHELAAEGAANVVRYDADTLPECLEREPNDASEGAHVVTSPTIVNGRIDRPGDVDMFRFDGRAGDTVVAEVLARRLDSPLDSVLVLTDAAGTQLAANDDFEDKGSGLETHHADSYLSFPLPADGAYVLRLADAQHGGGPTYAYRLRISAPRPDFELRATPSSLAVRSGGSVPMTVYALRRDGFAGAIELGLKDAPSGFTLAGARIAAGQDRVQVTLDTPPSIGLAPFALRLEGRATIGGRTEVREAVAADDMMQAFAFRHLVPAQSQRVAVFGGSRARGAGSILSATPVRIPAGGIGRVQVVVPVGPFVKNMRLELVEPPDGITIESVTPLARGSEVVLRADAATAKVGTKGNLIVNVSADPPGAAGKPAPKAGARRLQLGALPAIPFEVVKP